MKPRQILFVLGAWTTLSLAQTTDRPTVPVLVRTDVDCRLSVDGTSKGVVSARDGASVTLSPGEHRFQAISVAGGDKWERTVTLTAGSQEVRIGLRAAVSATGGPDRGYWAQPGTRLTWAAADNGYGVSFSQAEYYCAQLDLGGYRDWTLPVIEDLAALFGGPANEHGYHIPGPLTLTGWAWSSSPGKAQGERWALDFGDGARASVMTGDSGLNRALCVRTGRK